MNKPIIVVTVKGKRIEYGDEYMIHLFQTQEEADTYIEKVNDPDSKWWTVAEPIQEGQSFIGIGGNFYLS